MEYSVRYEMVKTPRQKLLENSTVQWFLYGDPNYIAKITARTAEKLIKEQLEKALYND